MRCRDQSYFEGHFSCGLKCELVAIVAGKGKERTHLGAGDH